MDCRLKAFLKIKFPLKRDYFPMVDIAAGWIVHATAVSGGLASLAWSHFRNPSVKVQHTYTNPGADPQARHAWHGQRSRTVLREC